MRRIDVFYIATDRYSEYFPRFLETIHNFAPGDLKYIHIISNKLGEYNGKYNGEYYIDVQKIMDLPYPLVPLLKTFYIRPRITDEMKYIFSFDADTLFKEMKPEFWNLLFRQLENDQAIMSIHPGQMKRPPYTVPETSIAHVPTYNFHVISSFFAGNHDIMINLCDEINSMTKQDLQQHVKLPDGNGYCVHYIPPLFDQDYFNKAVYDSKISFFLHEYIDIPWLGPLANYDYCFMEQKYDIEKKLEKKNLR